VTTITIGRRFCGPPTSGHGGYSAGSFALALDPSHPWEVRLRRPVPLEAPLSVVSDPDQDDHHDDGDEAELRDRAGDVVATARPTDVDVDPIEPVTHAEAAAAEASYLWFEHDHPFPTCFACGPDRAPGDGWRIFGGATTKADAVASRATCPPDLVDDDGLVPPLQVWSALDCITAAPLALVIDEPGAPFVLGSYAVDLLDDVPAHGLVAMSWPLSLDGRKFRSAGALYSGTTPVAVSTATWIQLNA
jgi:hypothetical protein